MWLSSRGNGRCTVDEKDRILIDATEIRRERNRKEVEEDDSSGTLE